MPDTEPTTDTTPKPKRGRKPKAPAAPRKPREKKLYAVEVDESSPDSPEVGWGLVANVEDTAGGIAWVRDNGDEGENYRVICIMAESVKVKIKQVRTLE